MLGVGEPLATLETSLSDCHIDSNLRCDSRESYSLRDRGRALGITKGSFLLSCHHKTILRQFLPIGSREQSILDLRNSPIAGSTVISPGEVRNDENTALCACTHRSENILDIVRIGLDLDQVS